MARLRQKVENTGIKLYNNRGTRICSIEGCDKKHLSKGYCKTHYLRMAQYGTIETVLRPRSKHSLKEPQMKSTNSSYRSMISRCEATEGDPNYEKYVLRGITVCDRWNECFDNFVEDMGLRPSNKHSIDRIDNDKGYSKDNCRWATPQQQSYNTRMLKTNTSGYTGVYWDKRSERWIAEGFNINSKRVYLGSFTDVHEAGAVATKHRDKIKKIING